MGRTKIDCCPPDCPLRHPACHGSCPDYAKQKAELDKTNEAKRKADNLGRAVGSVQYHSRMMAKKDEEKRRKQGRK